MYRFITLVKTGTPYLQELLYSLQIVHLVPTSYNVYG